MWKTCFEMAAICGVEPWNFTLKELIWMADAVMDHQWNLSASIQAVIAEVNRDRKQRTRPFGLHDFHPSHIARRRKQKVPMAELKSLFTEGRISGAIRERM